MKQLKTILILIGFFAITGSLTACNSDSKSHVKNKENRTSASKVKDKASLKAFVLSAKTRLEQNYEKAVEDFHTKKKWKKDSIYLYGLTMDGIQLFHVAKPDLVGKTLEQKSPETVKITKDLLALAIKKDGGFLEYEWDNPSVEGEDKSQKIGYAITFEKDGQTHVVGSGFYKTVENTQ